ncbi:MAG: hypothetical protein V3U71_05500 [Cocleimonas sp.]
MLKVLNKIIKKQLESHPKLVEPSEQDIFTTTSMMIGGVAIGRAINDPQTTEKLLDSCRQAAVELLNLDKN